MCASRTDLPNYKGVMICSRPEEAVKVKRDMPFLNRVHNPVKVGVNPIKRYWEEKVAMRPIPSKEVTKKHQRWLDGLEMEIQSRAEEAVRNEEDFKNFFSRFRNKSKHMRDKWRMYKAQIANQEKAYEGNKASTQNTPIDYNDMISQVLRTSNEIERDTIHKPKPRGTKNMKPAWAMSQNDYQDRQDHEIDDLVSFMDNFDPKQFVEDVEVRSIVSHIMERVNQLDTSESPNHDATDQTGEDSESHRRMSYQRSMRSLQDPRDSQTYQPSYDQLPKGPDQGFRSTTNNGPSNDNFGNDIARRSYTRPRPTTGAPKSSQDSQRKATQQNMDPNKMRMKIVKYVADGILKSNPMMAQIHSNASLRRLIEGMVLEYFKDNNTVLEKYLSPNWKLTNFPQPKTVVHAQDRVNPKQTAQMLPYLYPSPLI